MLLRQRMGVVGVFGISSVSKLITKLYIFTFRPEGLGSVGYIPSHTAIVHFSALAFFLRKGIAKVAILISIHG
jgi:hypothetical protein